MHFRLKNTGVTYQKLVNKMLDGYVGRNMEVYVNDMLVESKKVEDHITNMEKVFKILKYFNMNLNPCKCAFGAY